VTDSDDNTTEGSFTITVRDTTPPALDIPFIVYEEATGPGGAVVNFSFSAIDLVDGVRPVNCSPPSGSLFSFGITIVTCSASDTRGNTTSELFILVVSDTTPPVLNLPGNITEEATGPSGAAVNFSVSAIDLVDGSVNVNCNWDSGDTFPIGTTTVSCSARDARRNRASGNFTVTVEDTTPPALNLPANITEEATSPSGAVVTFSASATDIVDGSRPVTCTPASGSTFPLSSTTVTCSSSDTRGNTATDSFNVTIVDTTAPTLNLPGDITGVEATGPSGAAVTFTATATDIADQTPTVSCAPASGSTFGLGTSTVTCTATDASGNSTEGSFTITVVDTTPPTLTLPSDIIEEAQGPSGNAINYPAASATDIVDGTRPVTCTPPPGSTFPLGSTTVTCSSSDTRGNTATDSFTITVQDKTPPVIAPHENILIGTWKTSGSSVQYDLPTTFDIVDGEGVATCSPAPGSVFEIGETVVTCNATDSNGNSANPITFTVTIVQVDKPRTSTTTSIIPVTGGNQFDVSCIDPSINLLNPPGAKVTFINLCGYQAVLDSVQENGLPKTLPDGTSFVNGVTVILLQEDESINPLPSDASIMLGLPTLAGADGKYAILYWDGHEWTELNTQEGEDGFVDVVSKQTGTFILVTK
jgi:hypothetical protein